MLGGLAGSARGAVVGVRHGTEEPTSTAEQMTSRVEIRHNGPRIAAETTVTADEIAARSDGSAGWRATSSGPIKLGRKLP
jgi:hypothetical protein